MLRTQHFYQEKDSRFGWWTGKSVEVQKMPEKKIEEDEEDPREQRLREHREFIEKVKERKAKLQEDLKSKNITLEEENNVVDSLNNAQEESENVITPQTG